MSEILPFATQTGKPCHLSLVTSKLYARYMSALQLVIRYLFIVHRKKQNNPAMNDQRQITNQPGFTLLELMVTISIIAIVSAIGMTTFGQSQKLARDSRRKSDIRSIAIALELYYRTNKNYPKTAAISGEYRYSTDATTPWIPELTTSFINSMPKDPVNSTTYRYYYYSGNTSGYISPPGCPLNVDGGQYYLLYTNLENGSDPDRLGAKHYPWCDGRALDGAPYNWTPLTLFMVSSQ